MYVYSSICDEAANNPLVPALNAVNARFKALECARCGLDDRGLLQILGHLEKQNASLECLDISDNPGKINVERFQISMTVFSRLRKLDLSRVTRSSGNHSLFKEESMTKWRLEELIMNGVPVIIKAHTVQTCANH